MNLPLPNLETPERRCSWKQPLRRMNGRCRTCSGLLQEEPMAIDLPFTQVWWPYTEEENAA